MIIFRQPKVPPLRPLIILFGDDKTEEAFRLDGGGGWGAGLAEIYSRKADIIVRGYEGYSTDSALSALNAYEISTSHITDPAAVVVSFGANDITPQEYKKNLREILKQLQEFYPEALVVLLSPLPKFGKALIRTFGGTGDDPEERYYGKLMRELKDPAERFTDMCEEVVFELEIPFVNIYHEMQADENWKQEYFCDEGLHLTAKGNRYVCDAVAKKLSDNGLSPSTMEIDLPLQKFP